MRDKQNKWKCVFTDAILGYAKIWNYDELVDRMNDGIRQYCDLNDLDKYYRLEAGKGIFDFMQSMLPDEKIQMPLCPLYMNFALCDNEFRIMEKVKNVGCFNTDDNIPDNILPNPNPISPEHYKRLSPEPKDVIRSWGLNFNLGSAVKYISRAGHKDDIIQDLKKAQQFIQFEIDYLEGDKE